MSVPKSFMNTWFLDVHLCCLKGHIYIASVLIGRGVVIDAKDNEGVTPLMVASEKGKDDLVELLLDAGADVTFASLIPTFYVY